MAEATLDARGLKCPLPVLKMEKRLSTLAPGDHLVVLADDPIARIDIPLFCTHNGHACTSEPEGTAICFRIEKA